MPAWIACPACGYAMQSDAISRPGFVPMVPIWCANPSCAHYEKRFAFNVPMIDVQPLFEADVHV